MEIKEIYKLMERFEKSNISEMNLEMDSVNIQFKKDNRRDINTVETEPFVSSVVNKENAESEDDASVISVKAPLVGTFYRASSPDSDPFVLVGKKIKKGDVVGIIEAMKLMNEVVSPTDGVVTDILVKDESLVGYDEILIKIKES